jgi:hypothetical protein
MNEITSAGSDSFRSLKNTSLGKKLTAKVDKESGKDSLCPALPLKTRIIGFAVCCVLGKEHFNV